MATKEDQLKTILREEDESLSRIKKFAFYIVKNLTRNIFGFTSSKKVRQLDLLLRTAYAAGRDDHAQAIAKILTKI